MIDRNFNFYFESEGLLKYKNKDGIEDTIDEKVLLYSFHLDLRNVLHLVYLLISGELLYGRYVNGKWNKAVIANFDTKSNYYGQLEILLINNKLNILYSYSNYINSNIFTIHHVVYDDKIENRYSVVRFISRKLVNSFTVDNDNKGNIHLLYNTITNDTSYVYYVYFNYFSNKWVNTPLRLSSEDKYNENPRIFVDSKENLHSLWWEEDKNNYLLRYSRMSPTGKDRFKWNYIRIPVVKSGNLVCEITEEKDVLKVLFANSNSLLVSYDFGLNWKEQKTSIAPAPYISSQSLPLEKKEEVQEENENLLEKNIEEIKMNQNELILLLKKISEEQTSLKSKMDILIENDKKPLIKKIFNTD